MKKILFLAVISLFIFWLFMVLGNGGNYGKNMIPQASAATTGNVLLTGTVLQYIALAFSSGSTVSFGNITPGTAVCGDVSSQADVTTNASGGYNLAISDGSDTNSSMVHSDGVTYIPDMNSGMSADPLVWGSAIGVGLTMFSGTQKSGSWWGTGVTACDVLYDKWTFARAAATSGHTVTGYHAAADSSYWGWRVNVSNNQKTGVYSGNVLFTSTVILT